MRSRLACLFALALALPASAFATDGGGEKGSAPAHPPASHHPHGHGHGQSHGPIGAPHFPSPSHSQPNHSIFERLEGLFQTGTTPEFTACGQFGYAGRCFTRHRESAVKGAGYVISVSQSDNGPIDPRHFSYDAVSVWSDDLDSYDHKKIPQVVSEGAWRHSHLTRNGLRTKMGSVYSTLRMGGDYLIEQINDFDGRTLNYCYYYISLTQ